MRTALKGFMRGLGIQNSVLPYHILFQGGVLTGAIAVFLLTEILPKDERNLGIWLAMTITDFLLFIVYWGRLHMCDWHARSMKIIKRTNELAGTMPSDTQGLDQAAQDELEMQQKLVK